jgi:hypothetical protein
VLELAGYKNCFAKQLGGAVQVVNSVDLTLSSKARLVPTLEPIK